ncbi:MAG: CVNH domain-containing protein [Linnemannia gamsii]|nr:MAG: CVNH domain-containing protein [Linnemannia gamsii]
MGIVPEDVVCYIISYHDCYLSLGWVNTWGGHTADKRTRWTFTPVPHCLPSSNIYYIRSFNNKYLRREGSGCVSQCDNPYHECEWVVDLLPNGKYTFRLVDYLVCEKNGWIFANRKKAREWEQWTITSEYNPKKLSGPSGRAHLGFALGGITAGAAAAAGVGVGIAAGVGAAGAGSSGAGAVAVGAGAVVGAKSTVVGTAAATTGAGAVAKTALEIGKMAWKGFEKAAGGRGGNTRSVGGHGGSNQITSRQAVPATVESFATQVGMVICLAILFSYLPNWQPSNAKSIKDTCTNLRLVEEYTHKHTLTASCQSLDGSSKESSIDLDNFIGNDNGHFTWARTDFSLNRSEIRQLKEVTVLQGCLLDAKGEGQYATLDLAENIKNMDGTLTYIGKTPPPRPAAPPT